jgi:hypothetical protein
LTLTDGLLGKVRSVHAISDEEYTQTLAHAIIVAGGKPAG